MKSLTFPFFVLHGLLALFLLAQSSLAQSNLAQDSLRVPQERHEIQLSFAPVVKTSAPAVVNIYTSKLVQQRRSTPLFRDPFFEYFFQDQFGAQPSKRRKVQNSLGSGVIIDPKGFLVTNHHVIEGADEIKVVLADGIEKEAQLLYSDDKRDLAVLELLGLDGQQLPALKLADSNAIEVGDLVLAIGNPFGVGQTVTTGIISARARPAEGISDYSFFIQTDAAINPGNSGGALVNMRGELVGINTAIYSRSGGSIGLGFAIPANLLKAYAAALAKGDKSAPKTPWLGFFGRNLEPEMAQAMNLDVKSGVVIARLHQDSPLSALGLQVSDILVSFNDQPIENTTALRFRLSEHSVGEQIKLGVIRNKQREEFMLELPSAPAAQEQQVYAVTKNTPFQGVTFKALDPLLAEELDLEGQWEGVVIHSVQQGSYARSLGFRAGDLLQELQGESISELAQVERLMAEYESSRQWFITIVRDGKARQLRLRF